MNLNEDLFTCYIMTKFYNIYIYFIHIRIKTWCVFEEFNNSFISGVSNAHPLHMSLEIHSNVMWLVSSVCDQQ